MNVSGKKKERGPTTEGPEVLTVCLTLQAGAVPAATGNRSSLLRVGLPFWLAGWASSAPTYVLTTGD